MPKVTLDRETFKALASDTRLDILRTLDGKKMGLKDISKATSLNKATLHEHLGLVKRKEREGHKWVYYKLTWKGESLLHPENTRIVVLFTTTFIALWVGIIQMFWYVKGTVTNLGYNILTFGEETVMTKSAETYSYLLDGGITNTSGFQWPPGIPDFLKNLFNEGKYPIGETEVIPYGNNLSWMGRMGVEEDALALPHGTQLVVDQSEGVLQVLYQNPMFLYIGIACFIIFTIVLCVSLWRLWENKNPKL